MNSNPIWKIEEVYHLVLEAEADDRARILDEKCGNDEELREKVIALLGFADESSSLLDRPPMDVAAEFIASGSRTKMIGSVVGHYRIISEIGVGGMGEVYLAEDTMLRRQAAIKFIRSEYSRSPDQLKRFLREARAASALNHPNIITIYEIGESDGLRFIATEFIGGITLRTAISQKQLGIVEILEIAAQIAKALQAAHVSGIIHRDIKPENVILREDGLVKVLDFGLAKPIESGRKDERTQNVREQGKNSDETSDRHLTSPNSMMGTVAYISPEQARFERLDSRSDLWSLSVVLYEMINDRQPFKAATSEETIALIKESQPEAVRGDLPERLVSLIRKGLQKEAGDRFQTAEEMVRELNSCRLELSDSPPMPHNSATFGSAADTQEELIRVSGSLGGATTDGDMQVAVQQVRTGNYLKTNRRSWKLIAAGLIFVLFVVAAAAGYLKFSRTSAPNYSVAVLPFEDDSGDPELSFLSEGISESLINSLSTISELKVIARNSSFEYRGEEREIDEIARSLKVDKILRGRIAKSGETLQIEAEIIDSVSKRKVWGEKFDSSYSDVIDLPGEITQKIVDRLSVRLSEEEKDLLAKVRKVDPNAFKFLIKGHYYQTKGGLKNSEKALEYFDKALKIDPDYAQAWAAKASTFAYLGANSFVDPSEAMPKADAAAQKALSLDDNLAEVHHTLAGILRSKWDWSGAERKYKRAIELNPNLASVYFGYAFFLSTQGRHEEALHFVNKGRELDPLKRNIYSDIGIIHYFARKYDLAEEQFKTGFELNPNYSGTSYGLGYTNAAKGNFREAVKYYELSLKQLSVEHTGIKCYLGAALAKDGKTSEAEGLLRELENGKAYVSPVELAVLEVSLGKYERAFQSLEKAFAAHDSQLQFLLVEPNFDPIRSDPRFTDLLGRMGFVRNSPV